MDIKIVVKLLAGTLARGILWGTAALSARLGIEKMSEDTAAALAYFVAAAVVALVSAWWSKRKDRDLLEAPTPWPGGPNT